MNDNRAEYRASIRDGCAAHSDGASRAVNYPCHRQGVFAGISTVDI